MGVVTESKYVTNEPGIYTENVTAVGAGEFTFQGRATLVSLERDVPDLHFRFSLHLTIDPNGNLRSNIEVFEIVCK